VLASKPRAPWEIAVKKPRTSTGSETRAPSDSWALRVLEGSLVQAHLASAEEDVVTLAPLPGSLNGLASFNSDVAQSGACCPSGSCCASGSCCQSYSACVTVDEDNRRDSLGVMRREKRLWPIPV